MKTLEQIIAENPNKVVKPEKAKKIVQTAKVEKDAFGHRVTCAMHPVHVQIEKMVAAKRTDLATPEILESLTGIPAKRLKSHLSWFDKVHPGILTAPVFIPVAPTVKAVPGTRQAAPVSYS